MSSGTGKSTLLNVLNQRNIGCLSVSGQLRLNGMLVRDPSVVDALSGYVQQKDAFIGILTVAEHLWFQAMLRMDGHLSNDERIKLVDDVIQEVRVCAQWRRYVVAKQCTCTASLLPCTASCTACILE